MERALVMAWTPERELRELHLAEREARWWLLEPGDEGFDVPLHAYLGMTEQQWRQRTVFGEVVDEQVGSPRG